MKKDDSIYIDDIINAMKKIILYCENMKEKEFYNDEKTQDAIIRKLEIIGEASKNISSEYKNIHNQIPWKSMAGMSDKMIHDYAGVDLIAVWETIKILPNLIKDLKTI